MKPTSMILGGVLLACVAGVALARQIPLTLTKLTGSSTAAGQTNQWMLLALQTPGQPPLGAELYSNNVVKVYWPLSATNYSLILATNGAQSVWLSPPEQIQADDANQFILTSPQAGVYYYKLERNQ
jgi:hypothetical protein